MIRYDTLIKAVAAIALILLLAAGATPHAAELRPEQVYQQILPCVMTLEIQDKDGLKSSGTAFLAVKDGYAVTAWHVIDDAVKVTAKFADNAIYDVVGIVDKDEQKDLALIKLNLRGRPVSELFTSPPLVGSRAYVVGSPREFEFSISDGLISQVRTLEGFKQYQFTCPVSKGTSGSPVVNAEGKVVGVVSWSRKDSQNLNFATPASYISRLNASLSVVPWTVSSRVASRKLVGELSDVKEK